MNRSIAIAGAARVNTINSALDQNAPPEDILRAGDAWAEYCKGEKWRFGVPGRRGGLPGEEGIAANPEFREGLEIFLVGAGNCVFLSAFDPETIFSR